MNDLYYKPSGKFSRISFLYLLLGSVIAAPILAFIYSYATRYIPFIYINFLILAGFVFGLGFAVNFAIALGKVRNKLVGMAFGLVIGLAGLYTCWVIWICTHIPIDYMELIKNPEGMKSVIGLINDQGTWGFSSGANISGIFLTVIWVIEALAIIGVPTFMAYGKTGDPFIENDNNWAEETVIGPFEYFPNGQILVRQLEAKNYEELLAMKTPVTGVGSSHCMLTLLHGANRSQSKEFYLTVTNMKESRDKEGELEFDEDVIVNFIHINKEVGQQLFAKLGKV
jgi:hypothetical protein